jgi:hypothetical protein
MKEFIDFIIALMLIAVGGWIVLLFGKVFYSALSSSSNKIEKSRGVFKSKSALSKVDKMLSKEQYELAFKELRKLFFSSLEGSEHKIPAYRERQQGLLSRCLILAEHYGGKLENLPQVERLMIERTELLSLLKKAHDAFNSISQKRASSGKQLPSWGKAEYQSRVNEVKKELERNLYELKSASEELFNSIKNPPVSDEVTYH